MRTRTTLIAALALVGTPAVVSPASAAPENTSPAGAAPLVVSEGKETVLARHLAEGQPTVFVFTRPSSSLERGFLDELGSIARDRAGIRVVRLKSGDEPVAKQYEVKETPTALVYDRRGRLVVRSSQPQEIQQAVRKAAQVMRIDWPEAGDPLHTEALRVLGAPALPGILRTMSFRPQWMSYINDLSRVAHFSDGAIDRRTKEMIATYVSALNKCKY